MIEAPTPNGGSTPPGTHSIEVPPGFGGKNSPEISNKATILSEIDRTLGRNLPPTLECIWVQPLSMIKVSGDSGSGTNPYGHVAIRYTLPSGEQKVMNIVGAEGRELVNFLKPEDYLYGTCVFDSGSEQGGAYNRGMVSVRIEELPADATLTLDRYYTGLKARAREGDAGFSLLLSRIMNILAFLIPGHQKEKGNCARWTSLGLVAAGLLRSPTLWPKNLWVALFERYTKKNPSNVHVVCYRRVKHAVQTYGKAGDVPGLVAPLHWIKTRKYWNLENFADVIVEVPADSTTAEMRLRERGVEASSDRPS